MSTRESRSRSGQAATPEAIRKLPAFERLVSDIRARKVILFLGAGASKSVGMPDGKLLAGALTSLARELNVPLNPPEDPTQGYTLPEIAGYLERKDRRSAAIDLIAERFKTAKNKSRDGCLPYQKGLFRLLPFFGDPAGAQSDVFGLTSTIITTNWDDLLEDAFTAADRACFVVRRAEDLRGIRATAHNILKLHSDFQNTRKGDFILSAEDYTKAKDAINGQAVGTLWGQVGAEIAQKNIVFVGFSGTDSDVMLLEALVRSQQRESEIHHYMVNPDKSMRSIVNQWAIVPEVFQCGATEFFVALARHLVEFANRVKDRNHILADKAHTCMELYAPPWAGQSALLEDLEGYARGMQWHADQIVRVDLRVKPPRTKRSLVRLTAQQLGEPDCTDPNELVKVIDGKGRLFLIFEHTEALKAHWDILTEVVGTYVAPTIMQMDKPNNRSRLILSGRCRVEGWPATLRDSAGYVPYCLEPFEVEAVREMIEKHVLLRDPLASSPRPSEQLARQIYRLTGRSHPKFIKDILEDLVTKMAKPGVGLVLPDQLGVPEMKRYLSNFIDNTIKPQIWGTSADKETAFRQGLCVLRRPNTELLQKLSTNPAFSGASEETLIAVFGFLEDYFMVANDDGLWRAESVLRLVYGKALQLENPTHYGDCHNAAATAWQEFACLPSIQGRDQMSYFKEFLYHKTTFLAQDGKNPAQCWDALKRELASMPFRHTHTFQGGMGRELLKQIEGGGGSREVGDEELSEALHECLENQYDAFRQFIIKQG